MRLNKLMHIIKITGFRPFLISFISYIFISALILLLVEPSFTHYGDSLWYAAVSATTIGYGDVIVTTVIGKLISISLAVYSMIFFGCLTGVIINYYSELKKIAEEK